MQEVWFGEIGYLGVWLLLELNWGPTQNCAHNCVFWGKRKNPTPKNPVHNDAFLMNEKSKKKIVSGQMQRFISPQMKH